MEFNPLDLLASAAELQQKQDDTPPNKIAMVTQQQSNNNSNTTTSGSVTKPSACVQQKENSEVVNINNNNNINNKNKGITIIKKIKLNGNPEIEKMLNEHNYGNAKRIRYERNVESEFEGDVVYPVNNTLSDSSSAHNTETKVAHVITTYGKDRVSCITKSSSQVTDSECKCSEQCSVECQCKDKGTCTQCKCLANSIDKSKGHFDNNTDIKSQCDCPGLSGTADSSYSNKTEGQLPVSKPVKPTDSQCTQECSDSSKDKVSIDASHTYTSSIDSSSDSHNVNLEENLNIKNKSENEKNKSSENKQIETLTDNTETQPHCIDFREKANSNDVIQGRVLTCDSVSPKLELNSKHKKLPYVKVIPSQAKSSLEPADKSQTLVINISSRPNNTSKRLQNVSEQSCLLSEMDGLSSGQCEKTDPSISDKKVIKIVTINKNCETSNFNGIEKQTCVQSDSTKLLDGNANLSVSNCDDLDLSEKSDSYNSLKKLELSGSLCSDITSTSVHLLSPDRRNPDSMGIAESPITSTLQDLSGLSYPDPECDKNKINCEPIHCPELQTQTQSEKSDIDVESCVKVDQGENKIKISAESSGNKSTPDNNSLMDLGSSDGSADVKELVRDSRLTSDKEEKTEYSDNSSNYHSVNSSNDVPIFRFESDHCYAGLPRETNCSRDAVENEEPSSGDEDEVKTPVDSMGEISQDSGYGDVTHSPDAEITPAAPGSRQPVKTVKNLVPVLISVNNTGCLTLHSDPNISKQLSSQVLTVADNTTLDKGSLKLIPGTNISPLPQSSLILSPVATNNKPVLLKEQPPLAQTNAESILGLLRPTSPEPYISSQEKNVSPKFGKFRIGTFASFSNTGIGMETQKQNLSSKLSPPTVSRAPNTPVSRTRTNGVKTPPVVDTLGTLVQKVKSSLSPSLQIDTYKCTDHIQHDHDYCLKSLVPSFVSGILEAKLQKEAAVKGKVPHGKLKKAEQDLARQDSKTGKRKRTYSNMTRDDVVEDCDLDEDSDSYSHSEFVRPKTRAEKYIEQKSAEPKVKITGSSTFQDQFVYFMNTKKRSRRRESRDCPLPMSGDRVFIPPKPGDIIVPHLSDQDIENLKKRSKVKQNGLAGFNTLRNEFMAAKLSNTPFSTPHSNSTEPVVDEKNIINTILSLENENLTSDESFSESLEMCSQGLSTDMMPFLPEQMNLTQEQIDLLYSAVDEVQNSSPGLVGADKLVPSEDGPTAFPQFAVASGYDRTDCHTNGNSTGDKEETDELDEKAEDVEDKKEKQEKDTTVVDPESTCTNGDIVTTESTVEKPDTPVTEDSSELKSVTQPEFLVPETKELSGKIEETKLPSAVPPFSVANSLSTSAALTVPTSVAPTLNIETTSSNLFNKAHFITGPVIDSSENSLKNPITSASHITNTISSEISSLPPLDKSSFDLLGNEFRLDKTDLFAEPPAPSGPVDTTAPWIVTVSMYWNDLPAIMMYNQPYVRLVDIHKQILPAKDTGILKKRCQLMGIAVENCSEMQRYFLVQYGKAFNSKSTLIVSKDNAKELIGYYVDPQPKTSRVEDHKSIIDHRREQLRRIALARRAAIRARKVQGRKEEEDPRTIKEEIVVDPTSTQDVTSVPDISRSVSLAMSSASPVPGLSTPAQSLGLVSKRATRHKKINFLEMLRGDTSSQTTEEDNHSNHEEPPKRLLQRHLESNNTSISAKRSKTVRNKKVKIQTVKYTIESESSEETESNCTESEVSSMDMSDSASETEIVVVKKQIKQKLYPASEAAKSKAKARLNAIKKQNKLPLKVKIATGKRSKPLASSTPVAVQVVNKALPFYRSKLGPSNSKVNVSMAGFEKDTDHSGAFVRPDYYSKQSSFDDESCGQSTSVSVQSTLSDIYSRPENIPGFKKVIVETINEADLKIPTTLPDEILEEESKTREMETNTDFDAVAFDFSSNDSCPKEHESLEEKSNEPEDSHAIGETQCIPEVSNSVKNESSEKTIETGPQVTSSGDNVINTSVESVNTDVKETELSPVTERPLMIMKKKEIAGISRSQAPLKIIHRESSPLNVNRRSQLGELFIEQYATKRSLCIRCYTCRKMMSVDNFMRHMHDIVSGGLLSVNTPRTIDTDSLESDLDEGDRKMWEAFQRKKELFDNNQLPSPDIVQEGIYGIDSDSNHSLPDNVGSSSSGPKIITTPLTLTPTKKVKPHGFSRKAPPVLTVEPSDGVRSSSRKRKKKQLYPFEEYTFTKFPRLHGQVTQNGNDESQH